MAPKPHPHLSLFILTPGDLAAAAGAGEGTLKSTPLPSNEGIQAWGRAHAEPPGSREPTHRGGTKTGEEGGTAYSKEIQLSEQAHLSDYRES